MDEEIKEEFGKIWNRIADLEREIKKTPQEITPLVVSSSNALFDIEGESLTVLKTVGEKMDEKTKNITLLTLLGYKEKLGVERVLSSEIRRNVALNKIPLENFGTYLNDLIPQSILRVGKPKSKTVAYKLTTFGYARAQDLQKEILKNEQSK